MTSIPAPPGRRFRTGFILGILLVTAIGLGAALIPWHRKPQGPPRPTDNPVSLVHFAGTPQFAALGQEEQRPYLIAIRDNLPQIFQAVDQGKFTREEQMRAFQQVVRARTRMELTEHEKLTDPKARQKHLDDLIDEQEMLRKFAASHGVAPPEPNATQLKQFTESLSPDQRIELAKFAFDITKRRIDRGLPAWPFGAGAR